MLKFFKNSKIKKNTIYGIVLNVLNEIKFYKLCKTFKNAKNDQNINRNLNKEVLKT